MTGHTAAIMVMGTGSDVGKSTFVAALARALTRRGLKVMPFKPQNMSNNAAVTVDGGEIGRAQATQARAARVAPTVHMNPVLLKPETETGAQVIVQGKRMGSLKAGDYSRRKGELLPKVLESFGFVAQQADIVLIEGAGSASEVNLRRGDIANMGFAEAANIPVILVGDIERGGVIASLVGTHMLLSDSERARVKGYVINKFRGDRQLFDGGITTIAAQTGWPCFGILPHLPEAARLPAEDSVALSRTRADATGLTIAVLQLSRIANFDDLDPLLQETGVNVVFVKAGEAIPAAARLVIIPGTKATIADLAFLRAQGWDIDILAHVRRGGVVFGLCGGYQMLGLSVSDPLGIEGRPATVRGLGLLDIDTVMAAEKVTRFVHAIHLPSGERVMGYEIHMGETSGAGLARPLLALNDRHDGAINAQSTVMGSYLHGIFAEDGFRKAFLAGFGVSSSLAYEADVEAALEALADHIEAHCDVDAIVTAAFARQDKAAKAGA